MPSEADKKKVFSQEEQERCRESFLAYDLDRSGSIDQWELKSALATFGITATDEEVFCMITEVDQNKNGTIDYAEYEEILMHVKEKSLSLSSSSELSSFSVFFFHKDCTRPIPYPHPHYFNHIVFSFFVVDAFVACGGNSDRSGNVERDRLVKIVKEDFGLTIDIQSLIDKFENESGQLSFDE